VNPPSEARWRCLSLPVLAAAIILQAFGAGRAGAEGFIKGNYQINWDQNVDRTETETKDVRKFKHAVELKYKGFLSPVVTNEITFKFEQETGTNVPTVTRLLPTIDLGFKGRFWEAKGGIKRTSESSDLPGKNTRVNDSYYIEFFYSPPKTVPDLKTKYTLDKEFEAGTTDTSRQGITMSSAYRVGEFLDLKWDYNWNGSENRLQTDNDTRDEKYSVQIGLRHLFTRYIRFATDYKLEVSKGATLMSDGSGTKAGSEKLDQSHTWKNTLAYRPFRDTAVEASYDFDLRQNMINGEHTITRTGKAAVAQKLLKPIDLRADYTRGISDAKHTKDDTTKTEDTWTADGKFKFSKLLDFSLKYQKKHTEEVHHSDPTKDATSGTMTKSADWTGELGPFWKASASYVQTSTTVFNLTTRQEQTGTIEDKYAVRSTFDFKAINLTFDPSYEVTFKEDHTVAGQTTPVDSEIRDFKFRIGYRVITTNNIEAKFDHTYGRKTDSLLKNIERTDNTNGSLDWREPFPWWTFGFTLTRSARDTSGDDFGPDITTSLGGKADFKKDFLSMGTSFKYDKKNLSDDSETFDLKAGWVVTAWELTMTYTYRKTFSVQLQEGYSITLTFKYNL
jgi:hypothetical protein